MLNRQQQASLASAYALLNDSYQNYKSKLKELYGDEAHQKIVDAIAVEKAGNVYISAPNLVGSSSLTLDEPNPEDIRLFYDSFSNRYFESTLVNVMNCEIGIAVRWFNRCYSLRKRLQEYIGNHLRYNWSSCCSNRHSFYDKSGKFSIGYKRVIAGYACFQHSYYVYAFG